MDSIESYTGLSQTAFFTILALMFGVYKLVCTIFFVDPISEPAPEEVDRIVEKKEAQAEVSAAATDNNGEEGEVMSEEELRAYDGSDPNKPLLMAIKTQIYDVSPSRMFYGPGGPYALFAGRDASRALALMSFDSNDLTGNLEGLEASELEVLQDWEYKFQEKYKNVGRIITPRVDTNEIVTAADEHLPEASGREKQL